MRYKAVSTGVDTWSIFDTETTRKVFNGRQFIEVPLLVFNGTRDEAARLCAEYAERIQRDTDSMASLQCLLI